MTFETALESVCGEKRLKKVTEKQKKILERMLSLVLMWFGSYS